VRSGHAAGRPPAIGSRYDYNTYFGTSQGQIGGPNDVVLGGSQAPSQTMCFGRKRWTSREQVCVSYGTSGPAGALASFCGAQKAAPAAPQILDR
jgi:hypothetical protein